MRRFPKHRKVISFKDVAIIPKTIFFTHPIWALFSDQERQLAVPARNTHWRHHLAL